MDIKELPNLEAETKNSSEKGNRKAKLIKLTISIIILIASLVYAIDRLFTNYDPTPVPEPQNSEVQEDPYLEGSIKRLAPFDSPDENINYKLIDRDGETIVLLKSEDEKLDMANNLFVKVKGLPTKTTDGEDVLIVKEVIISSVYD